MLLVLDVKRAFEKQKVGIENYMDWAIGSLLISIVLILGVVNFYSASDIQQTGLGVLTFAAAALAIIFIRYFWKKYLELNNTKSSTS